MKKIILGIVTVLSLVSVVQAQVNLITCQGCHGKGFKKHALGKSKIVKDMNVTAISDALIGYKAGTYGGMMKGLMKGQVARYSNEELNTTAKLIKGLK